MLSLTSIDSRTHTSSEAARLAASRGTSSDVLPLRTDSNSESVSPPTFPQHLQRGAVAGPSLRRGGLVFVFAQDPGRARLFKGWKLPEDRGGPSVKAAHGRSSRGANNEQIGRRRCGFQIVPRFVFYPATSGLRNPVFFYAPAPLANRTRSPVQPTANLHSKSPQSRKSRVQRFGDFPLSGGVPPSIYRSFRLRVYTSMAY